MQFAVASRGITVRVLCAFASRWRTIPASFLLPLILLLGLMADPALAQKKNRALDSASLFLSARAALTSVSVERVLERPAGLPENEPTPVEEGEFQSDIETSPAISLAFKPNFFGGSNFAYIITLDFFSFKADRQVISDPATGEESRVDRGTSVSGQAAFITFVLSYILPFGQESYFQMGLGAGGGFVEAQGEIIVINEITNVESRVDISTDGKFAVATSGLFLLRLGNVFVKTSFGGPIYEVQGFKVAISENVLNLGIVFNL